MYDNWFSERLLDNGLSLGLDIPTTLMDKLKQLTRWNIFYILIQIPTKDESSETRLYEVY